MINHIILWKAGGKEEEEPFCPLLLVFLVFFCLSEFSLFSSCLKASYAGYVLITMRHLIVNTITVAQCTFLWRLYCILTMNESSFLYFNWMNMKFNNTLWNCFFNVYRRSMYICIVKFEKLHVVVSHINFKTANCKWTIRVSTDSNVRKMNQKFVKYPVEYRLLGASFWITAFWKLLIISCKSSGIITKQLCEKS